MPKNLYLTYSDLVPRSKYPAPETTSQETADWINNWLSAPETKRKLNENIKKYKHLYKTPESKYASTSTNVDTQLKNQKENLNWANEQFREYDHNKEPYKGQGIMGMYAYETEPNGPRDIWVSPRNIEDNRELIDKYIFKGDKYALSLGYPSFFNLATEEMVHATEPYPQEIAAEQILKEEGLNTYDVEDFNKDYLQSGPELYASLQRLRRLTGLKPGQNIDDKWIQEHKQEIEQSRLGGMDPKVLIRMNNELALNTSPFSSEIQYALNGGKLNYLKYATCTSAKYGSKS